MTRSSEISVLAATDPLFELPGVPLSIGGILDAGISLFRRSFKYVFPVAAIAAIPYALLAMQMNSQLAGVDPEVDPEIALAAAVRALAYLPVIYLMLVFIASSVIHRQIALTRGLPTSLMADFGTGLKLLIPLTIVMMLYLLCIVVGSILLLVPGIILSVSMCMFLWVPQIEERSAWSSLWRSHSLVWGGNWWRTAVVVTLVSIIGVVLSVLAYFGLGALVITETSGESSMTRLIIEAFLGWLTMAFILPLFIAVMHVHYNDLLLRKEGGDLDAKLSDIASTPSG